MKLKNKEHIFEYAVYFDETYEPLKKGAVVIIGQMHTDNKAKGCHSCCHFWAQDFKYKGEHYYSCLLYTSPSPRDGLLSRMPSSA